MSGDDTKTLGMIQTDANMHVMTGGDTNNPGDTNTVATWDNRLPTNTVCSGTNGTSVTSTTITEIDSTDRCNFMTWADAAHFSSNLHIVVTAAVSPTVYVALDSLSTGPVIFIGIRDAEPLGTSGSPFDSVYTSNGRLSFYGTWCSRPIITVSEVRWEH
jgi:hypothetical protein